ncbi:MAG TPA: adenine deaminase [Oceanithermus profundus]|uniref:Adenine deaminase n=1 Tax=Oceanithermus profundus TaxID=187137 RepID=A0A7C4V5E0_9DEIN|nr:adenine deaminase [Oceanithermus profundus]
MDARSYKQLLAVARGDAEADLVLANARVVDVFGGRVTFGDVAVVSGRIAGVGRYQGRTVEDLEGRYLAPGLIDAHVHLESSMVRPAEYARAVVPRGTTTVISDPHEIANVAGAAGVRYLLEASEGLPLDVLVNLPSCVPASHLSSSGARLAAADLLPFLEHPRVLGLAEFMNVPGAVNAEPDAVEKLLTFRGRPIDGHAPGVRGKTLAAYAAAGPWADHESVDPDEALEKVAAGLYVFLREGTAAQNLEDLLPAVTPATAARLAFCSDDRHPAELLGEGHVDHMLRLAVANGVDPLLALRMATLSAAEAFGLRDRGAVAPGRWADLVAFDDLERFHAGAVWFRGRKVAEDWRALPFDPPRAGEEGVRATVRVQPERLNLAVPLRSGRLRVIQTHEGQLITEEVRLEPTARDGKAVADPARDLAKLAVLERHGNGGGYAVGFVRGLGLERGAIAGSVGHDSHNLTVAGMDDASMRTALSAVARAGGGYAAALGDEVLAVVPLPIAGLISDEPIEAVHARMEELLNVTRARLGSRARDPFMQLAFLPLEVIPHLKLTDRGLVDVDRFELVDLWV